MLNPNAPEFVYKKPTPMCYSQTFSCFPHPSASPHPLPPYFCPYFQIPRPNTYNSGFMNCLPRFPEPPSFLGHSPAAVNSSGENSCEEGLKLVPELTGNVEEIPCKASKSKVEKAVSGRHRQFRRPASFPRCLRKECLIWRAKGGPEVSEFEKRTIISSSASPFSPFVFNLSASDQEKRTTVMIKNIPNRFRLLVQRKFLLRKMLLELLDKHCSEENEKSKLDPEPILSEYDFVYLLMDFRNHCNLGYAFVNFTTSVAAIRFYKSLHHFRWTVFNSKKICEIAYAHIQGRDALEAHFQNKSWCVDDECLPVRFLPPRNGSTSLTSPQIVRSRRVVLPK
ncbi:hypothetical protein ACLOJK_016666 [Asimina triloba]